MQPAQMRSGGSGSSVMTDTDYAEAVSLLLVFSSLNAPNWHVLWCSALVPSVVSPCLL